MDSRNGVEALLPERQSEDGEIVRAALRPDQMVGDDGNPLEAHTLRHASRGLLDAGDNLHEQAPKASRFGDLHEFRDQAQPQPLDPMAGGHDHPDLTQEAACPVATPVEGGVSQDPAVLLGDEGKDTLVV